MTSPPQTNKGGQPYPSPQQAAIYLNQAEYLSYRNPRIASYAQYLLNDPQDLRSKKVGLFSSGLLFSNGTPKPSFNAYRMPVWMPKQTVTRGQSTLIWGGARPAPAGFAATHTPQPVQIQQLFGGVWHTLATVNVNCHHGVPGDPRPVHQQRRPAAGLHLSGDRARAPGRRGRHDDLQPHGPGRRALIAGRGAA